MRACCWPSQAQATAVSPCSATRPCHSSPQRGSCHRLTRPEHRRDGAVSFRRCGGREGCPLARAGDAWRLSLRGHQPPLHHGTRGHLSGVSQGYVQPGHGRSRGLHPRAPLTLLYPSLGRMSSPRNRRAAPHPAVLRAGGDAGGCSEGTAPRQHRDSARVCRRPGAHLASSGCRCRPGPGRQHPRRPGRAGVLVPPIRRWLQHGDSLPPQRRLPHEPAPLLPGGIGLARVHRGPILTAVGLNVHWLSEGFLETARAKTRMTPFAQLRADAPAA
jgi:hypothetical protein